MSDHYHIVVLTPGFPSEEEDTTCIPALQIFLKALSEVGSCIVTVITFQYPFQAGHYQWHGIDVYALGGKNRRLAKPFIHRKAARVVMQIHERKPISVLHSFWIGECALVASRLAEKIGVAHICTAMGQDVRSGNPIIRRLKHMPKLITLSKFHAQTLSENYHLESSIIHWGLDERTPIALPKTIDVIGIGSLIPLKRFSDFLEIITRLRDSIPNIRCQIIGDGPERRRLKFLIASYGLEKHLSLVGSLPYSKVQNLLRQSKVLLHTSGYESFGMVVIEALDAGVPVVARSVGIAAELEEVTIMKNTRDGVEQLTSILQSAAKVRRTQFAVSDVVDNYLNRYTR